MNLAIASSAALPEKRFASPTTLGMLVIVTALVLITAVDASGISTLIVLALPVTLFALSLNHETSHSGTRRHLHSSVAAGTRTSRKESTAGAYFPSWLGSTAYSAACTTEHD